MEPEVHAALRCPVNWGSHGCGRTRDHDGPHACIGTDTGCGMEIARDGKDESGFQWALYTVNSCDRWWPGGNCELHEDHAGPHFDGLIWFNDDGEQVGDPNS